MKILLNVLPFPYKRGKFMFAGWNVFVRALIKEDYLGFGDSDNHLPILLRARFVSFVVIIIT
jgi:hypothetical protein